VHLLFHVFLYFRILAASGQYNSYDDEYVIAIVSFTMFPVFPLIGKIFRMVCTQNPEFEIIYTTAFLKVYV
jgi:hypothetical protein